MKRLVSSVSFQGSFGKRLYKNVCLLPKVAFFAVAMSSFLVSAEVTPVAPSLKQRQPQWRPQIMEHHQEGPPARVVFYEPGKGDQELPVKQMLLYPEGQIQAETDMTIVEEGSAGAEFWKSTTVPHGMSVTYFPNGQIEKTAFYNKGLLHGPMKVYFSNGMLRGECTFSQGERHGNMLAYYENGNKAEEGVFEAGQIVGEVIKYYSNGNRSAIIPYAKGVPHGNAMEWYEEGALKASLRYKEGVLHSDGKTPAVIFYAEDRSIQEVQDFQQGAPVGTHVKYHENGKEAYKVSYKQGKKEGKEQFFSLTGELLGEGLYKGGVPRGKHEKKTPQGTLIYQAVYDEEGKLLEPIREFSDQGIKIAEYTPYEHSYEGAFCLWYENGNPKTEHFYKQGRLEGSIREYYENGQKKLQGNYHNNQKEGLFEEWYEEGQLAFVGSFKQGDRDGASTEWYKDGQIRKEEFYVGGQLDKTYREWFPSGQLRIECGFALGKKQGHYQEFNEFAELIADVHYEKDLPVGVAKVFYGKNQLKEMITFTNEGKKEGKSEEYYPNGQLKGQGQYKNDLIEGEVKTWFEDGSLATQKMFKAGKLVGDQKEYFSKQELDQAGLQLSGNKRPLQLAKFFHYDEMGELDGEQKSFYPTGASHTSICYSHGVLNGMKAMWDQEGLLIEEATYDQGKLSGRFFERTPDGREIIYHYKDNLKEGLHEVYYPSHEYFGKVKALEVQFVQDLAEGSVIEYNEAGLKVAETPYVHGKKEGVSQIFSPRGDVMMTVSFHEDKKEGPSVQYYPSGQVFIELECHNDLKEGVERTFYEDGRLAKEIPYKADQIDGHYKEWNPQGILTFEGEYKAGKRHGIFNKYYDDGKPHLLQVFRDDLLDGIKKSYDKDGKVTEARFEKGQKLG